ncbi:hypothetical protein [Salibacterium halotolerans]|uniref:Uncharacterized protein n=1 Tax=Salibacterium halotolerans TaxID=1884432 RepID=A0A1I5S9P1_9BACI|nr:hypothetical protein [Salibacterium halotolerans]SFP67419.1 hypothetical protein SAMN05518683_108102 [Salibacterium halotolerans]
MTLAIIVLLIFILMTFFTGRRILSEKWVTGRKIFWVFGAYVLVLLVSAMHYSIFLTGAASPKETLTPSYVQSEAETLRNQFKTGNLDAIDDDYLQREWEMESVEEELIVNAAISDLPIYYVKGAYDHPTAAYYQSPSTVNGEQAKTGYAPVLEQQKDILSVRTNSGEDNERTYAGFKKAFPMVPFDESDGLGHGDLNLGYSALLLKVPQELDVQGEGFVQQVTTTE